jgi:biopolymer transport protein ExbD
MPKVEMLHTSSTRAGGRRARSMRATTSLAEINVVPLIDVMLVLLVIFMVAAPMMTQGFAVKLPESRRAPAIDQTPIVISVPYNFDRDRRVRIGEEAVGLEFLPERVRQALDGRANKAGIIACDAAVEVGHLALVFDKLIEGGMATVSIQTQPATTGRQP